MYAKIHGNYLITNKNELLRSMKYYYKKHGRDPFKVLPLTFVIEGLEDVSSDK